METMQIQVLAHEFIANKQKMDALKERNAEIARMLDGAAKFEDGKATAHILDGELDIKVTRKMNTTFDQEALNAARVELGDGTFLKVFKWKWEPNKKQLDAFLEMAPPSQSDMIRRAMTTKPGTPSVEITNNAEK